MNPPITPGEILLEEYLRLMDISQNAMSIRFGIFFGQSEDFLART